MSDKKHQVANPRGLPEGTRILHTETREFFEGDAIDPEDVSTKDFADLVKRGFVVEMKEPRRRGRGTPDESEPEVTVEPPAAEVAEEPTEEPEVIDAG